MAACSFSAIRRGLIAAVCVVGLSAAFSGLPPAIAAAPTITPAPLADLRGARALQALGARLPKIAARHRMSTARLIDLLRHDPAVRLDANGLLYFAEAAPMASAAPPRPAAAPAAAATPAVGRTPATAAYDPAATFLLHSHPGSNRTILLDFDGTVLTGTGFDYNFPQPTMAPPVTLDADPSTFNDAERRLIFRIWQRVAEDFAPFGVDVTTEETGNGSVSRDSEADPTYGVRVVITHSSVCGIGCNGIGGIAYLGSFDELQPDAPAGYYKPAMVFYDPYVQRPDDIAETASHEAGHTAGLLHDGNSRNEYQGGLTPPEVAVATRWAPIMGISDSVGISQWSKGDYFDASNPEDDFLVMNSHGLPPVEDDVSDTLDWPAMLSGPSTAGRVSIDRVGVIGSADDVDVYVFAAGAGPYSLDITTAVPGANLDLEARLIDAAGNTVAISNPPDATGAQFGGQLAAGTYRLQLDGVGARDAMTGYSDYGSTGQYRIVGSMVASGLAAPTAAFSVNPPGGKAPATIRFDASAARDPDGSLVDWRWDFGDGTQGSGPVISHRYADGGQYFPTLTVRDNDGLSRSLTQPLRLEAGLLRKVWVRDIAMNLIDAPRRGAQCEARVSVIDAFGQPVPNAAVLGSWSGLTRGPARARSGADGVAILLSARISQQGTCTLRVTGVTGVGLSYAPERNVETTDSFSY